MIEKLRIIFVQTVMISFGILAGISIQGLLTAGDFSFTWYHPASIIITGFLCSFPTLLLYSEKQVSRKMYIVRIVLHCFFLFALVMGLGWLFKWYTKPSGALIVAIEYVFVYSFVWITNAWLGAKDQKKINSVLDDIRDEE